MPQIQPADVSSVLALLASERADALASATRLRNQLHARLHQLDPTYQRWLPPLTTATGRQGLARAALPRTTPLQQAQVAAIHRLLEQLELVEVHSAGLAAELRQQARAAGYAPLTTICGVSWLTAGLLAGLLGPGQRFRSDARLAAYAGVAPLETASAGRVRHRLNRGGQRELNAIVHRIAVTQARWFPAAQAYLARRQAEGKSWREALRALKRYIVRAIWRQWQLCHPPVSSDRSKALT